MESASEVSWIEGQSRTVEGRMREISTVPVVPEETADRWLTTLLSVVLLIEYWTSLVALRTIRL